MREKNEGRRLGPKLAVAKTPDPSAAFSANQAARKPARILVVDDEAPVRTMIAAALEHQGFDIELASGGREALDALELSTFNLVLTDVVMQDVSGIALLERIHALQPSLPVVMVTAVHDISVAIDSMRRGAYDYLLKPFEHEQLLGTVTRALNHRRALEETENYHQSLEEMVRARTEMLRHAMEDLEHSYDVTLEALGDALDLKDSETEGHSKRVTAYAIALARAMGIPPEEMKIIARGAFLHDVGKMAIPDEILRKPGALTDEERELMREHCARGYQMLRKIPFLVGAAEIVFCHQEHFDGSGYPNGLRGREIPIGARIFAIADALDAITSDRPYRKATDFDSARQEILRCSGTQFDPAVVEVFLKIPNELWQELRSEISGQNKRVSTFDMAEAAGA
ncbi:MAG: response regulator [Terracidiphilus sp.]|nr:response regulator [Terracidiphilus sp.]MDR3799121.1 response regulator [Terracidiphilus sp.]